MLWFSPPTLRQALQPPTAAPRRPRARAAPTPSHGSASALSATSCSSPATSATSSGVPPPRATPLSTVPRIENRYFVPGGPSILDLTPDVSFSHCSQFALSSRRRWMSYAWHPPTPCRILTPLPSWSPVNPPHCHPNSTPPPPSTDVSAAQRSIGPLSAPLRAAHSPNAVIPPSPKSIFPPPSRFPAADVRDSPPRPCLSVSSL